MKKEPHHFTKEDFIRAFLGSFIIALTFMFKGSMVNFAVQMNNSHVLFVVLLICGMLTFEIYLLGYKYVNDRKQRPFLEFWAKRFFSIIASSLISIYVIAFAYGIDKIVAGPIQLFKVCVAVLLPAAAAGGAMEILKKS